MVELALCLLLAAPGHAAGPSGGRPDTTIAYAGTAPEGLVGNGRSVVKVRPDGFEFFTGGTASGRYRLVVGKAPRELEAPEVSAVFFPGGVEYRAARGGLVVRVLHGATAGTPYAAAIRVEGAKEPVAIEVETHGEPAVMPRGRVPVPLVGGVGTIVLTTGSDAGPTSYDGARRVFEAPYLGGLQLETPVPTIDRAVRFNTFLLDLGFDGRLHVCELFRWRDVWSRDLGSGLAPGAMASGRFEAARATIAYDLRRHAAADSRGLKVTEDPSQGGSAEGVAWLARAVWRYYLLTGDEEFLRDAARTMRPWVETWLAREAAESGLLVDVTEWMDHSRFFLFPDGARVLYSNVLFADLLGTSARIDRSLGDGDGAHRYEQLRARFVGGVNAGLWNEAAGRYDNLTLWGRRDERSSAAENALAVLTGVAPPERARRALESVRATNWRPAGSVTITPPMAHVEESNDHNYKVWPWWNAVEARARLRNGDIEGGVWLLERCLATLEDEHYPGLIEELVTPDGVSEGGHAFLTAAGSFLDAVLEGLLGVEVLEPGCRRIRVSPNAPTSWQEWSATVPLPQGAIEITQRGGTLRIRVSDPRVKVVEAPDGARVQGAARAPLASAAPASSWTAPEALAPPALRPRVAATFVEEGIPVAGLDGLPSPRATAEDLLGLDPADLGALVVAGNALPRRTRTGGDVSAALARYLDGGGALVFYGASMHDRGTMGETGGVIEWYELRPAVQRIPIDKWRLQPSHDGPGAARDDERGQRERWYRPDLPDLGWPEVEVPGPWEVPLGPAYDGWGWYRAHVQLPAEWRGRPLALGIGRCDDSDWTFVNGVRVGATAGSLSVRRYDILPGDAAYAALRFGGDNVVAVEVLDGGGAGGLYGDVPTIGVVSDTPVWTPIDPAGGMALDRPVRFGVVSWGPGAFFRSWETQRGAFGFRVDGRGASFEGPLASLPPIDGSVGEAFTDFAVARPWLFQPLAFTETRRRLLVPDHGERYPCVARVVDRDTGGEIMLIAASVARTPLGPRVLAALGIGTDASR